jgi:multidrug efflux pump subunit AcrB
VPRFLELVRISSQGHIVAVVAQDLSRNLAIGATLAVMVLFWMLGASRGIWALALSIPLSLLLGIARLLSHGADPEPADTRCAMGRGWLAGRRCNHCS